MSLYQDLCSEPESWQVLAPYDAEDARGLLKAAIRDPDPVVFLENEILYGEAFPVDDKVLDKDFTLPIGKCKVPCPPLGEPCFVLLVCSSAGSSWHRRQQQRRDGAVSGTWQNLLAPDFRAARF